MPPFVKSNARAICEDKKNKCPWGAFGVIFVVIFTYLLFTFTFSQEYTGDEAQVVIVVQVEQMMKIISLSADNVLFLMRYF